MMAEANQITYSFQELAGLMVRDQGITDGLWGIYFGFGIQGANVGATPDDFLPAAIVPVLQIGLQRFEQPNRLTVNAALINASASAKGKREPRRR